MALGLNAMSMAATALAAGVVPDGGTSTTATTGANGRITVGIANPIGGVSSNTYREFNVPRAGVDLDNNAARARTILNQVTSTNPSLLEGPLSVRGARANVVISNPNGVSVNGLVVQNVGNLALTTGQVSFNDFTTANGQLQRNLVLSTSQGAIDIGAEGLSGTLLNLELVARHIRVDGKVENLYGDPNARARAVAGASRAEIDTSVSPTDNLTPWISYSASATNSPQGIALDITGAGSLSSGRIEMMVTDQGAGVRHAGSAYAIAGDFLVSGTGDLHLASGRIEAKQDVLIGSGGLTGAGDISAGRHLQVDSDRVTLARSTLAAGTGTTGDLVIGTAGQVHSQPLQLTDTTLTASGGIGLFDAGAGTTLSGVHASAGGNVLIEAPRLTTAADAKRTSLTAAGTVTIHAREASLAAADVDGVSGTGVKAVNLTLQDSRLQSSGAAITIDAAEHYVQTDSDVLAAADVRLHAATVTFGSGARQSTLIAKNGGVLVRSDGDMTNSGSLIQGSTRIVDEPLSAGAVTVRAGGTVLNTSTPDHLGILFGVADDVVVRAGGDVVNLYARMLSNGHLDMQANGDVVNAITKTDGVNGGTPSIANVSGTRWLVLKKRTSSFDVDFGEIDRTRQTAYLLSDKGTTIAARNVVNAGGEIYANNGPIKIRATDIFRTEGITTGSAHYSRTCLIVCRTSASANTAVTGGLLSAGGDIDITAGKMAVNAGGRVLALGDLTVNAPLTVASGVTGYSAIARDRGFKAFFGDSWARLYAMDVGGSWMAAGHTRISGDVLTDGGSFDGDVAIAGASTVSRPRQRDPVNIENHLGLTSWFWR
ncbi:filamentous hemagglutinin family protein [Cupriavidus phytorum]|uniref:Filamentous hemagglutinin family protein n=1 Tax=Cupriavidus phytorum TaxID=3024399 RepID=A0A2W7NSV1_9BURK|nr:filamentous hemagglutinin N-terminal domain-containing protein [Cupriavidus alkaliphilus]PZX25381.1 filamentous hemagglutinin family protein [Cupriavidus alkaliphilus]